MSKSNRMNAMGGLFSLDGGMPVTEESANKLLADLNNAMSRVMKAQETEDNNDMLVRYGMLLAYGALMSQYFIEAKGLIESRQFNSSEMREFRENAKVSIQFTSSVVDFFHGGSL